MKSGWGIVGGLGSDWGFLLRKGEPWKIGEVWGARIYLRRWIPWATGFSFGCGVGLGTGLYFGLSRRLRSGGLMGTRHVYLEAQLVHLEA